MQSGLDCPKTLVLPVIIWQRLGGLEAVTMDIASTFASMGWRVKVFAVADSEPSPGPPGVEVVGLAPRNRWKRALWKRFFWKRAAANRLQQAMRGGGLLLFGHAHLLPLLEHLGPLPATHRWLWTYGLEVWGDQARRWVSQLNQLDRVVSISNFTATQCVQAGLTVPLSVVPCCVDVHHFTPTTTPERIRRNEILICGRVAGHEQYKGHDVLLESLPVAERLAGTGLTLRIVGGGDDLERLRAKAQQMGLADKVVFTGRVADSELLAAYRHCGLFCMPSRVDRVESGYWTGEGFGIVYVEAAACGRPVIASAEGGAPETVLPGESGLLVDPRSPQAVAQAIARIVRDPALADRMGQRGRLLAEERFSREQFSCNLRNVLCNDFPRGARAGTPRANS